jgi:DNA-directed RNA polymerase subunit K/omega
MGSFEFVVLAKLRALQLVRGCAPRVTGDHSTAVLAQLEVAAGKVTAMVDGAVHGSAGAGPIHLHR